MMTLEFILGEYTDDDVFAQKDKHVPECSAEKTQDAKTAGYTFQYAVKS